MKKYSILYTAVLCIILFSCGKKTQCIQCNGELIGCENSYNPAEWQGVSWQAWKATRLVNPDCQETTKKE